MEKPEQITNLTEVLDRIDRMREELVAIQRFLEKMEPKSSAIKQRWYRLYEAVLLELHAPRLNERLDAIDLAIRERLAELEPGNETDQELRMLADAEAALGVLRHR